ncbi:L-sorbose 1-dehydrogenase-like [Parasteatoda tepidariorum]|uniref:L-sorbose 1-dehydrogenase-like n=1 Tax=Parasteatoda tepidariorum TaxID=114398 RepID=UPI0039BC6973
MGNIVGNAVSSVTSATIPPLARIILPLLITLAFDNPKTTTNFKSKYDYIVVGAGAAGSVIAARLSEDRCVSVLLLEAGPKAIPLTEGPALQFLSQNSRHDWGYKTVPQKRGALYLLNRQMVTPRGKGLGGSTLLNYMLYVRGNRRDYDGWAKQGATGWSWKDVYPYFLKSEGNTDPKIVAEGYHNTSGPLTIQSAQWSTPLMEAWKKAAAERGYEYRDINGEKQTVLFNEGFHKLQGFTRNGRRCSASKAFLVPAQDRPNLDIVTDALVTKILIDKNKNAYGVKFQKDGKDHEVHINKEVIVSGGSINSPQLLMLSGIGPRKHLEAKGIPVIEDLPVGDNLQDHVGSIFLHFKATGSKDTIQQILSRPLCNLVDYNLRGTGPFASLNGVEGQAWVNSKFNDPSLDWPDLEIQLDAFSPTSDAGLLSGHLLGIPQKVINQVYLPYLGKHTFTMFSCFLRPFSRGTVRLATANPNDHILIDPNTFANASDIDRVQAVLQENVDIVTKTKAFKEIGAKLFETKFPGCEQFVANSTYYSPEYLRCIAVGYTFNFYHPVGTCKMGSADDKTTVVDPKLKVKGIRNLRVADGSIIPNQVSGNTEAPIIMIGEKCSDMIKADNPDRNNC